MERKFADRSNWSRIIKKNFKLAHICNEEFSGYVSAIYIDKVKEPLMVNMLGKDYCIVDDGYTWLQCLPAYGNYSLTTMYNKNKEIVQWYFDITKQNGIDENGMPFFDDLYLDVVVLPSSEILLLDEDELQDALNNSEITRDDYDLAYKEAKMLMEGMASDIEELSIFCNKYLNYINNQLE
jgi:predicted RNA-binding protein associated with RNAse of E/G family